MQAYWERLSAREKLLVSIASAMLVLLMLYLTLIKPLMDQTQVLQNTIHEQAVLLDWMNKSAADIKALKRQETDNPVMETGSITRVIEMTLSRGALASVNKQVRQNNQRVSVQFASVPTLSLLDWLSELWQQHRIQISKLDMTRLDTPGTVKANIELMRQSAP